MSKQKKKEKSDLLYRIVVIILLGIIVFSLAQLIHIMDKYSKGTVLYNQTAAEVGADQDKNRLNINWKKMKKKNKDTVAWIVNRGTKINYPVTQGEDNDYYLHHMLNGKWDIKGTIFVDYRCEKPFRQFNTIVYGHHMKDGSMFQSLVKYREADFYKKHKTMQLYTPKGDYKIQVFAAVTIPASSPLYEVEIEDKAEYLNTIYENTELKTNVEVSEDDNIVMLSTCTYEFDQARMVVYGKLVEWP